ncbi:MAG: GNAT family N-acetyltransferase [Thermoleophilia bacterium]|nr:GNAT family N-acetyltransferase [Thermoleophilia bacterium]
MREVDPAVWDGLLAELGYTDAYLRRSYVESTCVLERGRPVLLEHDGAAFACVVRDEPPDVVTPYGYGGPVGAAAAFWPAYEAWCRGSGVVTTFVRFHPLFANQRGAPLHVERLAPTIAWRLDGDLLAGMHSKHRNAVRKAAGAGLEVRAAQGLGEFRPLYEETMRRAGATPFYFFSPAYWRALAGLGDALARFDAVRGDEVVASALCLATPPWLHYHLGATAEAGRALGATTLLLYETARWAQERGYARFHLGGGLSGKRDSLHEFKRRFDPGGELEAAIGKAVHDPAAYRALGGDPDDLRGFFPAYRRSRSAGARAS